MSSEFSTLFTYLWGRGWDTVSWDGEVNWNSDVVDTTVFFVWIWCLICRYICCWCSITIKENKYL